MSNKIKKIESEWNLVDLVNKRFKQDNHKKAIGHIRTQKKHYLLNNLSVLLEESQNHKNETIGRTASDILHEHEMENSKSETKTGKDSTNVNLK